VRDGFDDGWFLVLRDPEGNVFCLLPERGAQLDDAGHAHYLDGAERE
jgi:hypothetical protein